MRLALTITLVLAAILATSAVAEVPPVISYQGKLMQKDGTPLPDGTYSVRFAIYDAPIEGDTLWSETNPNVAVKGGLFAVLLGSVNNLGANILDSQSRFLAIKVGSDSELNPRQRIASVATALRAGEADVAKTVPDGAITTTKISDGAVTTSKIAPQEPWNNADLINGWANFDLDEATDYKASYMKDSLGFVHLRGTIKSGTNNSSAFTLPPGYRPKVQFQGFVVPCCNGVACVTILSNGGVYVYTITGTTVYVHLTLSFKAEQ